MNPVQVLVEQYFDSFVGWLPVSYAFAVGMVAAVNPCGFALLPGYLGLYLRGQEGGSPRSAVLKAILVSVMMTLGFVLLFGAAGLVISAGGRFVMRSVVPWLALAMGVGLIVWGALMLTGHSVYSSLAQRAASSIPGTSGGGPSAFFLFGLVYGLCSLSCALPVFAIVVTTALSSGGFAEGMFQYLSYGLGMGVVILVLTLAVAVFKGTLLRQVRRATPVVERVAAVLVLLAGLGITYYWLSIGGLAAQMLGWL